MAKGANTGAPAIAAAGSHDGVIRTLRRLIALLAVVFVAAVASGCDFFEALLCDASGGESLYCEDTRPMADCIRYDGGQSVGTDLCGPGFDRDNDSISNNTETNAANSVTSIPSGFYTFDLSKWDLNLSEARGVATNGSLFKGMNLTNSWTGYTHYDFCEGNSDADDWGTGHLLRLVEATGRSWSVRRPRIVDMQVGDLSLRLGTYFPGHPGVTGCEDDHDYHQQGVDVDIRYVRKGAQGPLNICTEKADYDTAATITLLNSFAFAMQSTDANASIDSIFVDATCLGAAQLASYVFHKAGHQDHFHVRIRDPDGPSN